LLLATLGLSAAAACGDSSAPPTASAPAYSDDFGHAANPFQRDGGALDGDAMNPPGGGDTEVRVRFVHSILNVGALYVCHDPDLVLDDPATAVDEETAGPTPAQRLPLAGDFGVSAPQVLPALSSGTLTLHVQAAPLAADGGVAASDAGVVDADAGALLDAGPSAPEDCARDTRVAALTLSPERALPVYADAGPADAGATDAAMSSLTAGPLMLVASGLVLDPARITARLDEERAKYLTDHPGDSAGAEEAARLKRVDLMSSLGPRLGIEPLRQADVPSGSLGLWVSQLVPDVAGGTNMGPGAVRVCVTAGTVETPVQPPARSSTGILFRDTYALTPISAPQQASANYRFRVFASSKFDMQGSGGSANTPDCAGTSLTPLAELTVPVANLAPGHSYGLVLKGAVSPSSVCAPVEEHAVVRTGCPLTPDQLAASLQLIE